jgi:hypothetical protein
MISSMVNPSPGSLLETAGIHHSRERGKESYQTIVGHPDCRNALVDWFSEEKLLRFRQISQEMMREDFMLAQEPVIPHVCGMSLSFK